jgi:hypothetical protein
MDCALHLLRHACHAVLANAYLFQSRNLHLAHLIADCYVGSFWFSHTFSVVSVAGDTSLGWHGEVKHLQQTLCETAELVLTVVAHEGLQHYDAPAGVIEYEL